MPRARPYTQANVAKRRDELGLNLVEAIPGLPVQAFQIGHVCGPTQRVIDKLIKDAGIAPPVQQEFTYKLRSAIVSYRVRTLAHQQEKPASIVAALKPVLKAAKALQHRCTSEGRKRLLRHLIGLPASLRLDLGAGDLEQLLTEGAKGRCLTTSLGVLIEHGEGRQRYWQAKIRASAPTGSAAIGEMFREQVLMILDEYRPDVPEPKRRQWAGDVWEQIGDAALDSKKHSARFKGNFVTRENALFETMLRHIAAGRVCLWGLIEAAR